MKLCIITLFLILTIAFSASAADMSSGEYIDAISAMTQDSVVDYRVITENALTECGIEFQQPDARAMALLEDMYQFIWHEKNRPIEYYDEETQLKVQKLVPEVDTKQLHMTEFMALSMKGEPTEEVKIQMLLDVDYQVNQLVVAIYGYQLENGEYRWFPYLAEIPLLGLMEITIPEDDYVLFTQQDKIIFNALSLRVGPRGDILIEERLVHEKITTPSKDSTDIIRVEYIYNETYEEMPDSFIIYLVDKTDEMNNEMMKIASYLAEKDENEAFNPIINWFPEDLINEAQLLVGEEADLNEFIVYDAVAVMSKDYNDTFGDVSARMRFASVYSPDKKTVVMIGFPLTPEELSAIDESQKDAVSLFKWYCLNAEAIDESLEVVFKQLVIPKMETEPAMMIVLSEPLEETVQ